MPQKQQRQPVSGGGASLNPKTLYLIAYNLVSAALWSVVLYRTATTYPAGGPRAVFRELDEYTRRTQTLALLEVVHSALGIVRSPIATTVTQVASRIFLVWCIAFFYPESTAGTTAYSTMLVAWSVTEVVRYTFFVFTLGTGGNVPSWLTWLRYNTFFVLYPLGAGSETWCMYQATEPAKKRNPLYAYILYGLIVVYAPGLYIMYTHMIGQRRRVMRGKQRVKSN